MENPAYKLHSLLKEAYEKSQTRFGSAANYKNVWCDVFGIELDDTSALLTSLNSMINLWASTKEYIQNNEMLNDETNIKFLDKIEKAISNMNFEGNMSHFETNMDNETLTALWYMAKNISLVYKFNNQIIDEDEIETLIAEIDSLTENIIDSSLPEEVRLLLLKNLNLIRESLFTYKISGRDGMLEAFDQTIGSVFRNHKILPTEDENVKGLFNIIDKLNSLLSTGLSFKELMAPIIGLLIK